MGNGKVSRIEVTVMRKMQNNFTLSSMSLGKLLHWRVSTAHILQSCCKEKWSSGEERRLIFRKSCFLLVLEGGTSDGSKPFLQPFVSGFSPRLCAVTSEGSQLIPGSWAGQAWAVPKCPGLMTGKEQCPAAAWAWGSTPLIGQLEKPTLPGGVLKFQ